MILTKQQYKYNTIYLNSVLSDLWSFKAEIFFWILESKESKANEDLALHYE